MIIKSFISIGSGNIFDIAKAASLVMCFQLVEICVIRQIALEVLRLAECIEISKYGISLDLARVGDLDVIRVGVHAHDFFLDLIRLLGQVNAVSKQLCIRDR